MLDHVGSLGKHKIDLLMNLREKNLDLRCKMYVDVLVLDNGNPFNVHL